MVKGVLEDRGVLAVKVVLVVMEQKQLNQVFKAVREILNINNTTNMVEILRTQETPYVNSFMEVNIVEVLMEVRGYLIQTHKLFIVGVGNTLTLDDKDYGNFMVRVVV